MYNRQDFLYIAEYKQNLKCYKLRQMTNNAAQLHKKVGSFAIV